MGRPSIKGSKDFDGRLYLRLIRLDVGGYDSNGTYFGQGHPLYWFASEDGEIDDVIRAVDRDDAMFEVRKLYPKAKFYGERKRKAE